MSPRSDPPHTDRRRPARPGPTRTSASPDRVSGNGFVTFALKSSGTTSAYFSSKEGAHAAAAGDHAVPSAAPRRRPTPPAPPSPRTARGRSALGGSDPETCELTFSLGDAADARAPSSSIGQRPMRAPRHPEHRHHVGHVHAERERQRLRHVHLQGQRRHRRLGAGDGLDDRHAESTTPRPRTTSAPSPRSDTPKVITLAGGDVETCDLTFTVLTRRPTGR